jgi:hypothetical protein
MFSEIDLQTKKAHFATLSITTKVNRLKTDKLIILSSPIIPENTKLFLTTELSIGRDKSFQYRLRLKELVY